MAHDRRQCYGGFTNLVDNDIRPRKRTRTSIINDSEFAKDIAAETPVYQGVYADRSPLLDLSYFDMATMTLLDMMHLTSGVIHRHLMSCLTGDRLKSVTKKKGVSVVKKVASEAAAIKKAGDKVTTMQTNKTKLEKDRSAGRESRSANYQAKTEELVKAADKRITLAEKALDKLIQKVSIQHTCTQS